MRIAYFGSGAFGLPTLKRLAAEREIALVVTQPDRPSGRQRAVSPTVIGGWAARAGLPMIKPERINDPATVAHIRATGADTFVVIAYGQKLGRILLAERFAINLHGSLLPKYRGAAPVNWAIINGETTTGLSVITLAERMDAGAIFGQTITPIDPMETAGELHDRLAGLGPELVLDVLSRHECGRLRAMPQDEAQVTHAPKLSKSDGTVSFDQPADAVRARVHGLTPWPGCRVLLDSQTIRLHRVAVAADRDQAEAGTTALRAVTPGSESQGTEIGTIIEDDHVQCARGRIRLLAVHPPGGKLMTFAAYRAGHAIAPGARFEPLAPSEMFRES